MPLYNVAVRGELTQAQRSAVSLAVIKAHCGETDAPEHFVNVYVLGEHVRCNTRSSGTGILLVAQTKYGRLKNILSS